MKRKFTIVLAFIALLFGTANAQVVFDPATYPVDSLPAGMTMDTIDGTVYLMAVLDGWNSWIQLYDEVTIVSKHTQFKAEVKYGDGVSGFSVDQVNTFLKLSTPGWTELTASGQASDSTFKEYKVDGLAEGDVVGIFQFAGQETTGWSAVTGDTLWVGKITAVNPNAFLDPYWVVADSLPADWTLDTIDGEIYFRILLDGWNSYWEFYKDLGAYMVPAGVTAFKTMSKYSAGTSGFEVDNINTFLKFSDESWAEIVATGAASDSVFIKHNASIADSSVLGVLQVAGQERTGWSAVTGDTLWVGVIEAEFIDSLILSAETDTIDINKDTIQLTGQVYPMDFPDASVTWSISDTNVAEITEDGMLIALGNGEVWATAVANGAAGWMDSIKITLMNQVLWVDTITISSEGDAVTIDTQGGTLQFYAVITPEDVEDTTFTWMVTPEGFATIDTNGLLTASADGSVTVTAMANDLGGVVSNGIEVTITNQVPVTSISVIGAGSVTEISDLGGTLLMFAAVLPENASNPAIVWSVDNEAIATISAEGLLTAVTNGDVVVTATAADGSEVFGTVTITISGQNDNVENVSEDSFVMYPNPVANTLFIENAESFTSFDILTMDGKLMLHVLNSGDRMSIDVSGLSNGMYIIRGYQVDQIQTFKLIK